MAKKNLPQARSIRQSIKTGDIKARDLSIIQKAASGDTEVQLENSAGFVEQINKLVNELATHSDCVDVKEAQEQLKSAAIEAQKPQPNQTIIRKLLYIAKGFVEQAAKTISPLITIATAIERLTELAPKIFNK